MMEDIVNGIIFAFWVPVILILAVLSFTEYVPSVVSITVTGILFVIIILNRAIRSK